MTIHGMNKSGGGRLEGLAHLQQSIWDILMTRTGERVMRRDYGCEVPDLIDRPMNPGTVLDVYMAAAEAIDRWEPRFQLTHLSIESASQAGQLGLAIRGNWFVNWPDTGTTVRAEVYA